jgi:glycosyltransferase involved in cell wall biosynthesis
MKKKIGWPWTSADSMVGTELALEAESAPAITLVMPSYNQAEFLEAAIESVIRQNYPNLEFIVRDGGSTDGSVEIVQQYEDKLHGWVSEPDGGQAAAINKGWQEGTGELLGWLNSDDILAPRALHKLAKTANRHPEAVMFFGNCGVIDEEGRRKWVKSVRDHDAHEQLKGRSLGQPSVFIRRRVIEDIGLLDDDLKYALDWAYFLKVFWTYSDSEVQYVPEVISCSREYEGTKSRTGLLEKGEERREKLAEYVKNGVFPNAEDVFRKGLAGTYWVQGTDQFLAGKYVEAFRSGAKAIYYHPRTLLEKIPRVLWLVRSRIKRLKM